jgi:transposase
MAAAKKPAQPIPKSMASPGLLASVAVQKYQDALPLYRQTEIFKRIGIELDRTTLANWMIRCGQLVQPLINLIHEKMLDQNIIHADETRIQVLNEPGAQRKRRVLCGYCAVQFGAYKRTAYASGSTKPFCKSFIR